VAVNHADEKGDNIRSKDPMHEHPLQARVAEQKIRLEVTWVVGDNGPVLIHPLEAEYERLENNDDLETRHFAVHHHISCADRTYQDSMAAGEVHDPVEMVNAASTCHGLAVRRDTVEDEAGNIRLWIWETANVYDL